MGAYSTSLWGGVWVRLTRGKPTHTQGNHCGRRFKQHIFFACTVLDIGARCSWTLTLMPITIVTTNIIHREVMVSMISFIEILRRSMWVVLRIEHEQVSNASGFRSLLWVPHNV